MAENKGEFNLSIEIESWFQVVLLPDFEYFLPPASKTVKNLWDFEGFLSSRRSMVSIVYLKRVDYKAIAYACGY